MLLKKGPEIAKLKQRIKDTLKDRLKNQFQYKDDLNIKKFWG